VAFPADFFELQYSSILSAHLQVTYKVTFNFCFVLSVSIPGSGNLKFFYNSRFDILFFSDECNKDDMSERQMCAMILQWRHTAKNINNSKKEKGTKKKTEQKS